MSRGDSYNFEYDDTFEIKNKKVISPFDENAYEEMGNSPDGIRRNYYEITYATAKAA